MTAPISRSDIRPRQLARPATLICGDISAAERQNQVAKGGNAAKPLLLRGARALYVDGAAGTGRELFQAAYRAACADGDRAAVALAALGLAGLKVHEHRGVAGAALIEARLRAGLAGVDQQSPVGLRLRARLAAESDYRACRHDEILSVLEQARQIGDPIAIVEAASLAHHCLLVPGQSAARRALAQEQIAASFQTGRRGDLLMGMLWRLIDHLLDGDLLAERLLAGLREQLAQRTHHAVEYAVAAIEVMFSIRAGRLDQAELQAQACAQRGWLIKDPDATAWHGGHMVAIRWYQGRLAEMLPTLRDIINSPTLSSVDNSFLAAYAVACASSADYRRAAGALARLRGGDLARLARSPSWLVSMHAIVEAGYLLADTEILAEAYRLLTPLAFLPMMASLGVVCFGSVHHALGTAALGMGNAQRAVEHLRAAVRDNLAIGHRPAATLSRARLAQALALAPDGKGEAEAAGELDLAKRDAAELGVALPSVTGPRPPATPAGHVGSQRVAIQRGAGRRWKIELGARAAVVEHCVGMNYLAVLMANPGQEIAAAELAAGPGLPGGAAAAGAATSAQPLLDEKAQRAYKDRLSALRAEIDEYEANNDLVRARRARDERDWLIEELSTATGLRGRIRRFADADERARVSVRKAIQRALMRIAHADPVIGEALRHAVRTGVRCSYVPL